MSEDTNKFIIPAEAHTDDHLVEVKFDAVSWFRQADGYDLVRLVNCEFRGDYPADEVAEFCANNNEELQRLFTYLSVVNNPRIVCGFECSVDEQAALDWLKARHEIKIRRPEYQHGAELVYRHELTDNEDSNKPAGSVVVMASASWVSVEVWSGNEHLSDVSVELFDGKFVARVWKTEDLDTDPTAKVELCDNPNASKKSEPPD